MIGMILRICAEPGVLRVIATGEFSLEEAERTFVEMLDAVVQYKTEKIVFDGRELKGEPETIDRFFYGEFAADTVNSYVTEGRVPHAVQFAYVLLEPVLDPHRFGETAAVNRGMWVKAFDHLQDALGWLGIAPASQPDAGDACQRA